MIRKALPKDMEQILKIYQTAREYMKKSGNERQWGDAHPPVEMLENDIDKGQLYVVEENGVVCGVFAFIIGEEPTYRRIEAGAWIGAGLYGTIHRVASDGKVKGIFSKCLEYCKSQHNNIRIDTHPDNTTMQHLIEKNGFEKCGIIYVEDGSPRVAYQYISDNR